jgi:hypothetical protein
MHRERRSAPEGNEVNPRHAAALALVGWYLMVPPVRLVKSGRDGDHEWREYSIEPEAPLREWTRPKPQEFEYKTDCQRVISNHCNRGIDGAGTSYFEGSLCDAKCIATDDPRLKEK